MKRIMCVWFPNWTIQRRRAIQPSDERRPLLIHAEAAGKTRVVACCHGACRRGVRVGMLLVEAQALWPAAAASSVRLEPHDPAQDREQLRILAHRCQQFSPVTAIDDAPAPDCLLLDVTGCTYGFDGEEGLAAAVGAWFHRRGYQVVVVIADTKGAAWAVAHYGALQQGQDEKSTPDEAIPFFRTRVISSEEHRGALASLPLEALRLSDRVVETLHELNVFQIEQLLALPRRQLPARFGIEILRQIDRARGDVVEVITPEPLAEPLQACWEFEYPVVDARVLQPVLEHLLERLLPQVDREHFGVHRLECFLKLAGHDPVRFAVELLRPCASQRDLLELLTLQMERWRLPAEVLEATLSIAAIRPLEFHQDTLFGGSGDFHEGWQAAALLERLNSRLGERAVLRARLYPDAQPEFAYRYEPLLQAHAEPLPLLRPDKICRPPFLKACPAELTVTSTNAAGPPTRFAWNKRQHIIERSWGPERIETGWWRGQDIRRDYFLVETHTGERFWLFHNLIDNTWRLHGSF